MERYDELKCNDNVIQRVELLMIVGGIRYGCHAETFVFRTFPTGHAETRIPFGGGFSEAIFSFAIEIMLSSASSTSWHNPVVRIVMVRNRNVFLVKST